MRLTARKRYAVAVDTRRCVGCNACVLACKGENALEPESARCWITSDTRGFYPDLRMEVRSERCNQCSDAPCVTNCPTGASHYGPGGIVLVDAGLCTGCKACMAACPYEARFINPAGVADKCTFCVHRVDRGLDPACVTNCPTHALTFGDANDPGSAVSRLLRERNSRVLTPEEGTEPNVHFLS